MSVLASRARSRIMVSGLELALSCRCLRLMALIAMLLGLATRLTAQEIPALAVLPAGVAAAHLDLVEKRSTLMQQRATLHNNIDHLNSRCAAVEQGSSDEVSCNKDRAALVSALNSHIQQSKNFNLAAHAAIVALSKPSPSSPALALDPESLRVINGINALAKRLGWTAEKRAQLDKALHALDPAADPNPANIAISGVWRDIIGRRQDASLLRDASQGGGLGFPGAGQQIAGDNDCTIFALANATGLPYGVGQEAWPPSLDPGRSFVIKFAYSAYWPWTLGYRCRHSRRRARLPPQLFLPAHKKHSKKDS